MGRTIRVRGAGETASTEGLLFERATLLLQRLASSEGDVDILKYVVAETTTGYITFPRACSWPLYYWLFIAESPPRGGVSIPEVHERDQ
jgi:hypothetical protein